MVFKILLLSFILSLGLEFNYVCGRPSVSLKAKVCDSREFLNLYQRTCKFYDKRRAHDIHWHGDGPAIRSKRQSSNLVEEPSVELARKCCEEGCSVELIGLHCGLIDS